MAETLKEFFIKVNFDNSGFDKLQQKTKQFTENVTSKFKVETDKQIQIQKSANEKMVRSSQQMANSQVAIFKKIASYLPAIFSTAFIKSSVSDFVKKGMEADETSSLLGITPEAFQQISGAFNRFGVESSSMAGQLSAINKQIQQAEKGTGRLKIVLDKFGLTIKNANGEIMSADEFLLSMSDQLKNFDGKTRGAILAMMGFDNSIQSAFSDGGEALMGFLAKQKELMLITQKDTEMAKKFTFQMKDLRDNITRIKNVIARFFLPILTKLAEITTKFINWIFKHKTAFVAILAVIALSLKGILASLTAIVIKGAILAAPFIALGALIVGLILLFEDIYYYFNGWDSVTGELVKKFPSLETALKPLEPLVKMIGQAFEDIAEFFANPSFDNFTAIFENIGRGIIDTAQQWGDVFIDVLATSLNGFIDLFNFLDDLLTDIFTGLKNWIIDTFTAVFKWFGEKIEAITKPLKNLKNSIGEKVQGVKNFFGFGGNTQSVAPLPVVNSSNAYSTNNNFNQNIEVSVNGSVDRRNADYLAHSIGNQLRGTNFQNGSTGRF